jgi:hypothetical protein
LLFICGKRNGLSIFLSLSFTCFIEIY